MWPNVRMNGICLASGRNTLAAPLDNFYPWCWNNLGCSLKMVRRCWLSWCRYDWKLPHWCLDASKIFLKLLNKLSTKAALLSDKFWLILPAKFPLALLVLVYFVSNWWLNAHNPTPLLSFNPRILASSGAAFVHSFQPTNHFTNRPTLFMKKLDSLN